MAAPPPPNFTPIEKECLQSANDLRGDQGNLNESGLAGRNAQALPIYELDFNILIIRFPEIGKFLNNDPNNSTGLACQYSAARRENHNDVLGSLPDAAPDYNDPNTTDGYYEYHVETCGVKVAKNIRFIYDSQRQRLYVSPSHYNAWRDNSGANMNPFFLIANAPPLVCNANVDFG